MTSLLTELLNIENIDVTGYRNDQDCIVFEVSPVCRESTCPHCGHASRRVHQNHYHLAQDLPISGKDVFIKYNRRQFKCKTCQKPFSEALDFMGERRQYTNRFAEKVVSDLIHGNIHNVAINHPITDDIVASMMRYVSQKKKSNRLSLSTAHRDR